MNDEREDGEILDEDDDNELIFEDVSDCSITSALNSGKSQAYQDNISILSLSSVSANSEEFSPERVVKPVKKECSPKRRKRRSSRPRHRHRNKRTKPPPSRANSSSDDEDRLNRTMLRQLKEAVRINKFDKQNNLQERLKQMLHPDDYHEKLHLSDSDQQSNGNQDEDAELEQLRCAALTSKTYNDVKKGDGDHHVKQSASIDKREDKNDTLHDQELIELRLEALKSAVIQKSIQRKKRKEQDLKLHAAEVKEIPDTPIDDTNKENTVTNQEDSPVMIQTSGTLITKEESSKQEVQQPVKSDDAGICADALITSIDEDVDIMRAKLLASMSKKIMESNSPIGSPKRDVDGKQALKQEKSNVSYRKSSNNHNHLLSKMNFVQMTSTVQPIVINLNDESESDSESASDRDIEKQSVTKVALADKVTELLKKTRAEVEANTKKIPMKQKPINLDDSNSILNEKPVMKLLPKSQQQEYRMLKQKLLNAKKLLATKKLLVKQQVLIKSNNNTETAKIHPPINNNFNKPQVPQKELPMSLKSTRLQMKGKYKELEPLINKVDQTSLQMKKMEQHIHRLLTELKQAKKSLQDSQTYFSKLVKELILKKDDLDKRVQLSVLKSKICTSTPLKTKEINDTKRVQIEEKPISDNNVPLIDNAIEKSDDIIAADVIPGAENFSKYISPLGTAVRNGVTDPLGTVCPYEIFGVCKDPECTYKHYS